MPALLNKKDRKIITDGLWEKNPITFQVLGICSALAVTVQLKTALVMAVALTLVLTLSNGIISLMRNFIPSKIRIIVQLSVISSLVIIADQVLKATMYDVSKQLSVFVGLIITNCIVMGRAEAFAMQNPPVKSMIDGLANGIGYSCILICIGILREIFGTGKLLGHVIIPHSFYANGYVDCGVMVLAPGAFFLLGSVIWIQRAVSGYKGGPLR